MSRSAIECRLDGSRFAIADVREHERAALVMQCRDVPIGGCRVEPRVHKQLAELSVPRYPLALDARGIGRDGLAVDISEAASALRRGAAGERACTLLGLVAGAGEVPDDVIGRQFPSEIALGLLPRVPLALAHQHLDP